MMLEGKAPASQGEAPPSKGVAVAPAASGVAVAAAAAVSPAGDALGSDFRVQLQLLECVANQGRLLQRLSDRQEGVFVQFATQLAALRRSADDQCKAERVASSFFDELKGQQDQLLTMQRDLKDLLSRPASNPRPGLKTQGTSSALVKSMTPSSRGCSRTETEAINITASPSSTDQAHQPLKRMGSESSLTHAGAGHSSNPSCLRKLLDNPKFDWFCGLVIALNAFSMGYTAEFSIRWGIDHVGEPEWPHTDLLHFAGYFFVGFY